MVEVHSDGTNASPRRGGTCSRINTKNHRRVTPGRVLQIQTCGSAKRRRIHGFTGKAAFMRGMECMTWCVRVC
jgi:hypothetical protein